MGNASGPCRGDPTGALDRTSSNRLGEMAYRRSTMGVLRQHLPSDPRRLVQRPSQRKPAGTPVKTGCLRVNEKQNIGLFQLIDLPRTVRSRSSRTPDQPSLRKYFFSRGLPSQPGLPRAGRSSRSAGRYGLPPPSRSPRQGLAWPSARRPLLLAVLPLLQQPRVEGVTADLALVAPDAGDAPLVNASTAMRIDPDASTTRSPTSNFSMT